MRSSDLFYGLLAAVFGFGAVVALAAGLGGTVPAVMAVVAILFLGLMVLESSRTPQVLLVGLDRGHRPGRLEAELDAGGYAVAFCPGPQARTCPVLAGHACPVRARPVATVAYLDAPTVALPPCRRHFRVPTLAVDRGSVVERDGATTGTSLRHGRDAVVGAVRALAGR